MDKAKTSKKQKKHSKKLKSPLLVVHDPFSSELADPKLIKQAVLQALMDGDLEAVRDVLIAHLQTINKSKLASKAKLDDFASGVYQIALKGDLKAYSILLHPDCILKEFSKGSFQMRSNLLKKQNPGAKIEAISISKHRQLKIKSGHPFEEIYKVEPSHYVIVWPLESLPSKAARIDLNPILKTKAGWKILDGSCVSSSKRK